MRVNPIPINASVNPRTILFAITCAAILSPFEARRSAGRPPTDARSWQLERSAGPGTLACVPASPPVTVPGTATATWSH